MTYSAAVLALSPARYYKLDDVSGTSAADSSASGVAATYYPGSGSWSGGTLGATGAVDSGTAAAFDGSAGCLTLGDYPIDGASAATFAAWVNVTTAGDYRTLFSKFDSTSARFEISLGNSGEYGNDLGLVVSVGDASAHTGAALTVGSYHHVVVVFDGAESGTDRIAIYVDGSPLGKTVDGSIPSTVSALSTTSALIGARTGGGLYWHGAIDDVALFGAALTATQVSDLYAAASGGSSATLDAATVAANGAQIALTFSGASSPTAGQFRVLVDGQAMRVSAVSGSGASHTITLGLRWVRAGQVVTVAWSGGSPVTATNGSTVTDDCVRYVGRRFGMFVHWGIETFLGVDWSDGTESINTFAPTASVASGIDQWIAAARSAGMRYIVLTAKHHGGLCLWPSAHSARTIAGTAWYAANGSPDILRLFVDRVRAAGLGVGVYFSVWDRYWQSVNAGYTGAAYTAFVQAQLSEILSNYGPIDALWLDGWGWQSETGYARIPYATIRAHVASLQPHCVVVENNHESDLANTDVLVFEGGSYGAGAPANNAYVAECCDTIRIDNYWFWRPAADAGLSASTILSDASVANSRRATYLLNCPPGTDALLPATTVATLAEVGAAEFESVTGISADAGTAADRTLTLTLTTNGASPAGNLTGLRWAWWDQGTPDQAVAPTCQGVAEVTDGSGVLSILIRTRLPSGGVGWLVVTDSNGATAQNHSAFSGPATV